MDLHGNMLGIIRKMKDHDRKVPLLRGRIYFTNFLLHLYYLRRLSRESMRPETRMSFIVCFLISVVSTIISSMYHHKLVDEESRSVYKRVDYAVIFLLVVSAYFPLYVYFIKDNFSLFYVLIHWGLTLTGVFSSLLYDFSFATKWVRVMAFVTIGLFNFYVTYRLYKVKMLFAMLDVNIGSFLYLLSGFVYASKFPNPVPRVFEHHEIVHILIVVGNFFTFRSNYSVL